MVIGQSFLLVGVEVQYVVLSVNTGFLNLESKYFAIPWQVFSFNTVDEVLVLDIDKDRLKNTMKGMSTGF